jgi:hypothetical protein
MARQLLRLGIIVSNDLLLRAANKASGRSATPLIKQSFKGLTNFHLDLLRLGFILEKSGDPKNG